MTGWIGWDRAVFKFDFEFAGVNAAIGTVGAVTEACAPATIQFLNLSSGADAYAWDFATGDSSTAFEPGYTFADTGTYTIRLIASSTDSSLCLGSDTAFYTLHVGTDSVHADFDLSIDCAALARRVQQPQHGQPGNRLGSGTSATATHPPRPTPSTTLRRLPAPGTSC